ncbi:aromatic ring-hydroxylating oxygenase subunit alpha [Rhizorhabdus argentea]|uniref:aromatic ring-hydroxylating oxygenase subunit alpha n=1 Tax=Rhizorhabdus argentea TaxID=1387174 RepID=UPI0030EEF7D6
MDAPYFINYPDDEAGPQGAKAPYVDLGTSPPDKRRYYSREEADLEWSGLWMKTWALAGLLQDIPEVGDFLRYELGKESFIVVRTGKGENDVKAYYNVCPHRGNRLVHTDFGATEPSEGFQCDFHGWKFSIEGRNTLVRDEEIFRPEVLADRPCLTKVSVSVWNSLIFVNPDPQPRLSLLEHLDVIPEHCANYDFSKFRVFRDLAVTWDANWKTALEAFIEFYHADDVHPELLPLTATRDCQYDLYDNGISRMIIEVGSANSKLPDREVVNEGLKSLVTIYGGNPDDYKHLSGSQYKRALADTKRKWGKKHGYEFFEKLSDPQITDDWNYFIFPNVTLNVFADSLLIQIFRPHATDPSKSHYNAITLCLPVSDDETPVFDLNEFNFGPKGWKGDQRPARFVPKDLSEFGNVLAQDAIRVPEVQKGIESASFKGSRLSESEIRIRHYLAEIDKYLGRTPKA